MAVSIKTLLEMKQKGERIAALTAYDASFSRLLDDNGVDVILVGDSLGMVIQGADTTLSVSMNDMIYHARNVSAGSNNALLVVDLPFMSYNTVAQALGNAARLVAEGGAHVVKLEGGEAVLPMVSALNERGIAVCGHLGLTPQSIHKLGGYRVQGRNAEEYQQILHDAENLQAAGASLLVLECVPGALAEAVKQALTIPVIGIGAGSACDGQVLVVYDALGISDFTPKFNRNFMSGHESIAAAVKAYVHAVKTGEFPAPEHHYD